MCWLRVFHNKIISLQNKNTCSIISLFFLQNAQQSWHTQSPFLIPVSIHCTQIFFNCSYNTVILHNLYMYIIMYETTPLKKKETFFQKTFIFIQKVTNYTNTFLIPLFDKNIMVTDSNVGVVPHTEMFEKRIHWSANLEDIVDINHNLQLPKIKTLFNQWKR